MLQRQKLRTVTRKSQKQQHPQEKQIQQENLAIQEQENLGDYTMDRGKFMEGCDCSVSVAIDIE